MLHFLRKSPTITKNECFDASAMEDLAKALEKEHKTTHMILFVQRGLLPSLIALYWQTPNFSTDKHCNVSPP